MEEDEEDIWEEKSLRKLKGSKKNLSPIRKACNKSSKRLSKNVGAQDTESGQECSRSSNGKQLKRKRTGSSTCNSRRKQQKSPVSTRATPQKTSITDGFCPKCQMPFCAIIGQSPGWHVRECLEAKYSYIGDCKDGIHCKSTFSPHFKRYSHTLLATTRSCGIFENTNKEKTNESVSQFYLLSILNNFLFLWLLSFLCL
ncbi:PREDICTED: DNA cross-link repair 1A protein-like [Acropora digitifera]|uniref:DNA cross-link repair 1A protein-like n=1 Tax=Acropora digitifera TaxID=70779 RepID=UPI00077AC733|nr:PREDICTED: DNA cross-link repair 1A protein-like [Acropora digitifera]